MSIIKYQQPIAYALATIVFSLIVACSKPEQVTQPAANAQPTPASGLESKSKEDLARIRELMEKEEARKQTQVERDASHQKQMQDGSRAPVPSFGR